LTALLGVSGALLLFLMRFRRAWDRRRMRLAAGGALLLGTLLAGIAAYVLSTTPLGAEWRRRLAAVSTVQQRLYYGQSALAMWRDAPIVGQGGGGFALLYPQYRIAGAGEAADPHNWALRILAEQGIVGLALFLAWVAASLAVLRQNARHPLAWTAALGVVLLLFNGLLQHAFATRELYVDFALLLGIVAGAKASVRKIRPRIAHQPLRVCALFLIAGAWPLWIKPDLVQINLDNARTASTDAGLWRAEGNRLQAMAAARRAHEEVQDALRLAPNSPWVHDFLAVLLFFTPELHDPERALAEAHRAIELHPRSAAFHDNLALMYEALGRHEEALGEWEKALALHPLDEVLYAHRAQAYERAGNLDQALEDAYRAATLTMRSSDRYWAAYEALFQKAGRRARGDRRS